MSTLLDLGLPSLLTQMRVFAPDALHRRCDIQSRVQSPVPLDVEGVEGRGDEAQLCSQLCPQLAVILAKGHGYSVVLVRLDDLDRAVCTDSVR